MLRNNTDLNRKYLSATAPFSEIIQLKKLFVVKKILKNTKLTYLILSFFTSVSLFGAETYQGKTHLVLSFSIGIKIANSFS